MTLTWTEIKDCPQPHRESYWLRGFKHGSEGMHEVLPTNDGPFCPANCGYMNGYRAGMQKFNEALMDKLAGRTQ